MKTIKVGFDFDGTLTRIDVQRYARLLVKLGVDVHIVTARRKKFDLYESGHEDLMTVACKLGILDENIHFLNTFDKSKFYRKNSDFAFHLDDNWFVVDDTNEHSDVIGICVLDDGWVLKCDELIKDDPMADISKEVVRKRVMELLNSKKDIEDPAQLLMVIKKDIEKLIRNESNKKE
jgi:hypothetical protein